MKSGPSRTQDTEQTERRPKISKTTYGPEKGKTGNKGKENHKVHEEGQGNKEVGKVLFGQREGEKMDVTKVIQTAMIDIDKDRIEWDSGDKKEELEAKKGTKVTTVAKKGMQKNPLYKEDKRKKEEENTVNSMERSGQ